MKSTMITLECTQDVSAQCDRMNVRGCYRVVISGRGRCHMQLKRRFYLIQLIIMIKILLTAYKILSLIICNHSHLTALEAAQCK